MRNLLISVFIAAVACGAPADAPPALRVTAEPAPRFNDLFQGTEGWIGADGVYPVAISEHGSLYLFSDTLVGKVKDGKRVDAKMVNNSVAVQRGRGAEAKLEFFIARDDDGKPRAVFQPADGEGWFWPFAGYHRDGKLFVFLMNMAKAGDGGAFGFKQTGATLAAIANPADPPAQWRITQKPVPHVQLGGEGNGQGNDKVTRVLGSAVLEYDGHVYIYGFHDVRADGWPRRGMIVARTPADRFDDFDAWRFYDGGDWSAKLSDATPLFTGFATEASVTWLPRQKRFVTIYTENGLSANILARFAQTPVGPWSDAVRVYRCPEPARDKGVFCYAAKAQPQLSAPGAAGELIISYACNATDFWDLFRRADLYWPSFVRLRFE